MKTRSNTARTAEATPNLRERAERLRDAAGRFVRRKTAEPSEAPECAPIATVSPALASMVTEWVRLAEVQDSGVLTDEEADAISPEWSRLHGEICRFPARSTADLAAKAPLYRYKRDVERASCKGESTMPLRAWESVVQDIEGLSTSCRSTLAADPILAAITETRRLTDARTAAASLPQPAGSIDPLPEQDAASEAFFAHVDGVLLKTVPTTAAGCVALARYAGEFLADEGFSLDENQTNEQHVRILDLIARSPMLGSLRTDRPMAPDFSGLSSNSLIRIYEAFRHAFDMNGLTTWALHGEAGGSRILDAELDRLAHLQNDIADELTRRAVYDGTASAGLRFDVLIHRAVACGDYEEAARLATDAKVRLL